MEPIPGPAPTLLATQQEAITRSILYLVVFVAATSAHDAPLPDEGPFPGFAGGTGWVNTASLAPDALKGRVMLVNFWTFSCSNCLAALPHIKAIEAQFRDRGLLVVGVHTPELAHERVDANVRRAVHDLGIVYPVVIDGTYAIWNGFHNEYWPAVYLVDAHGRVRYHHFGEGAYAEEARAVDELLHEASSSTTAGGR